MDPMGSIQPTGPSEPATEKPKADGDFPSITRADRASGLQAKLEGIAHSSGMYPPAGEGAHPTPGQMERISDLSSRERRVAPRDYSLLSPKAVPEGLRPHLAGIDLHARTGDLGVQTDFGQDSTPGLRRTSREYKREDGVVDRGNDMPLYARRGGLITRPEVIEHRAAAQSMVGAAGGRMGTLDSVEHDAMMDDGIYPVPGDPLSERALRRPLEARLGVDPVEGRQPTERVAALREEAAIELSSSAWLPNEDLKSTRERHRELTEESRSVALALFERNPSKYSEMPTADFVRILTEYVSDRDELFTIEGLGINEESAQVAQIERILGELGPDVGVKEVLDELATQADIPDMPQHQTFENFIARVLENKKQAIEAAKVKARRQREYMAEKYGEDPHIERSTN